MAGPLKISASKLGVAEQCELHFYLKYVKWIKMKVFDNPAAFMGTVFHSVVEMWYTAKIYTKEALMALIDKAWIADAAQANLEPETHQKADGYKKQIATMLNTFYEDESKVLFPSAHGFFVEPIGLEKKFEILWDPVKDNYVGYEPIIINGFIDRVMRWGGYDENDSDIEGAWITDWKTQKELPDQEYMDNNIQLTFYSAAYRWLAKNQLGSKWPPIEDYVELYFPRHGKYLKSKRTKEHFYDMKERLIKVIDISRKQNPQANPSVENCKYCEYYGTNYCPATKGALR
jgi:ATP-dependent helicase/DNAse subunit B